MDNFNSIAEEKASSKMDISQKRGGQKEFNGAAANAQPAESDPKYPEARLGCGNAP